MPHLRARIVGYRAAAWPILLSSLLLLLGGVAHGQSTAAVLRKDLKKDFGAVGDGRTNDQAAFEKAAAYFTKRAQTPAGATPAVLAIPRGVYLVGRQDAAGNAADVLPLVGCRNLTIQGADSASTEIRYAAGLRYGAFDPTTLKPFEAPNAFFTDYRYAARVGTCITLQKCENVTIAGLAINGNCDKAVVGGHWGDTGIQLNYDGIFVGESRRITLRQLALHHLGRDGIQVLNHLAQRLGDPALEAIVLENLTSDYNGRQGLSVTGVNGLRAIKCSFSHTGRVVIPALGKALFSNPGAGVDLEPENAFVQNVRFDNCRLVDNAGQALVSDRPGNDHRTSNIVVANSLLWGTTNWSAWVTQPNFLFTNCRFYGAFVHGCHAGNAAEATRFVGCTFENKPYHGRSAYGPFTFYSERVARYTSFTDCRFVGTHSYLVWVALGKPEGDISDTASFFHLRGCTFLYDYTQPTQGAADKLQGAVFSGVNIFRDGPHRTSQHPTQVVLGDSSLLGSTLVRAPGSLQLLASKCIYTVAAGLAIGQAPTHARDSASVIIGPSNSLVISAMKQQVAELYIGPTSRLVLQKGAALEVAPHTKVTIAGQLIVADGAYLFIDPAAPVAFVGQGRLRLGTKAIKGRRPAD